MFSKHYQPPPIGQFIKQSLFLCLAEFKFYNQVKKISKTVKLNWFTFRLIRECVTFEAANIHVHAVILSHLGYSVTSWSQAGPSVVKPPERNRALKTKGTRPIRSHLISVTRANRCRGAAAGNCTKPHRKTSFGRSSFCILMGCSPVPHQG